MIDQLTLAATAARFDQPAEWARYHVRGQHICVDGKTYVASCWVSDPVMESTARNYIERGYYGGAA
jgi:hypothetical protein